MKRIILGLLALALVFTCVQGAAAAEDANMTVLINFPESAEISVTDVSGLNLMDGENTYEDVASLSVSTNYDYWRISVKEVEDTVSPFGVPTTNAADGHLAMYDSGYYGGIMTEPLQISAKSEGGSYDIYKTLNDGSDTFITGNLGAPVGTNYLIALRQAVTLGADTSGTYKSVLQFTVGANIV